MLIIPARLASGITRIISDEHDADPSLLGIIAPLKYNPPSSPLSLPLGPSPVRH